MTFGLLLLVFGVLVAVFPQILVALISTFFIVAGLLVCLTSWQLTFSSPL